MHAAEDLVLLGEPEPLAAIQADLPKLATEPIFRIVLWRIQARQATAAGRSMDPWTRRIAAVFFAAPDAPDRVNAAETLGKLGYNPPAAERPDFEPVAQGDSLLALHARWVMAGADDEADEQALAGFLTDQDAKLRGDAAYALRFRPKVRPATRDLLISAAEREPAGSSARSYLFSSALFHADEPRRPQLLREVRIYVENGSAEDKFEAMNVLALVGGPDELDRLSRYLKPVGRYDDSDADLRVAAGNAILHIVRGRNP
jgi:hypothetical protein